LRGADLGGADLRYSDLHGADLRGADLSHAILGYTDLRGADIRGANCQYADLRSAAIQGADFAGADLHGARLAWAEIQGADLRGADLHGSDLAAVELHGRLVDDGTIPATIYVCRAGCGISLDGQWHGVGALEDRCRAAADRREYDAVYAPLIEYIRYLTWQPVAPEISQARKEGAQIERRAPSIEVPRHRKCYNAGYAS
ncbi:MAG: hypothetical protein C4320_00505, partial [Armatimonadota bacterium]